ncbi:TPA: Gp37 family protein [Pasteurella multocida]|nr:hypothetical protein [Pasteurella multocida]
MSATQPILNSIQTHLLSQIDRFAIELFPDNPSEYFLRDESGAILIQYAGSKFERVNSTDIIQQRRTVTIALTVIARSQHNDDGALAILDQVRLAIVGFRPENCLACALINEEFAGEADGLWQYQLLVQTETWQVEQTKAVDLPKLATVYSRTPTDPLNPILKPKS